MNIKNVSIFSKELFFILVFSGLIGACHKSNNEGIPHEPLFTEPEEYFILDSTVMGISTIASHLEVPWEITWGPDGWIWFSEIKGKISKVNPSTGETIPVLELKDVYTRTTPGLMGMAHYQNEEKTHYLLVLYNMMKEDETIVLNVKRYTVKNGQCQDPKLLLEVPGSTGHNGSRIKVGQDGKVYIATGEASKAEKSQNVNELGGKVLRINIDGSIPSDNPFPGNPVWAWGFRNPQGLVLTEKGVIYNSDHGDATDDEVNLVVKGGNFGWPDVRGYCDTDEEKIYCADSVISEPLMAWTPTLAPAGMDYYASETIPEWKNSLLLATLKGSSLRVLQLNQDGTAINSEKVLFDWKFGRLRDICISPSGDVYISTSNRDWRASGLPQENDDRIIRLFNMEGMDLPDSIPEYSITRESISGPNTEELSGEMIYRDYCASCHKEDGKGIERYFPPLSQTETVLKDKEKLIKSVLHGVTGIIEVKGIEYNELMPSFSFLSDEEIAKVLSFIRANFGNDQEAISAEEVKKLRE